jgi:hypothetical protein
MGKCEIIKGDILDKEFNLTAPRASYPAEAIF